MSIRRSISVILGCLAVALLIPSAASAGHEAENPTWDPGYRMGLQMCDQGEYIQLRWRVELDETEDFHDAEDQRIHMFFAQNAENSRSEFELNDWHWNVEADQMTGISAPGPSGRQSVHYKTLVPSAWAFLKTAWVTYGEGSKDSLSLVAVHCQDANKPIFVERWMATPGNPAETH